MSVFANAAPTMGDSQQNLLVKICEAIASKFPMATTLVASPTDSMHDLLYKIAYNINLIPATGGSGSYSGIGDPNGSQTGAVASSYFDLTDPDHPIEWVKTTGAGNTGWVLFVSI